MSSYTPQRSTATQPSRLLRPPSSAVKTPLKTPFKSPRQRPRVLATTINNRSVSIDKILRFLAQVSSRILIIFQSRQSGNFKKRKSVGKSSAKKVVPSRLKVPKIVFSTTTTDSEEVGTDSYDTFQVRVSFGCSC